MKAEKNWEENSTIFGFWGLVTICSFLPEEDKNNASSFMYTS